MKPIFIGLLWASAMIIAALLTIFDVLPNSVMAWAIPLASVASALHINAATKHQGRACGCPTRGA